jgi:hypothetical protein
MHDITRSTADASARTRKNLTQPGRRVCLLGAPFQYYCNPVNTEEGTRSSHLAPCNVSLSAKSEIVVRRRPLFHIASEFIHDVSSPVVRWPLTLPADAARSVAGGLPNSPAKAR